MILRWGIGSGFNFLVQKFRDVLPLAKFESGRGVLHCLNLHIEG